MPNTDFETAILRFRDLATPDGGTIERHKQKIRDHGATWWGWWNKAGERVPLEAFSALQQKVTDGGKEIYLFDSGQYKLYRASCNEIKWEGSEQEMTSPDPSKTPDYYVEERECLAWFRFTRIDEIDEAETDEEDSVEDCLHQYSYYRVDDLFKDDASRFEPFYGKRVVSLKELRYQERTVWFVRPYQRDDSTHELLTPAEDRFRPQHFTDEFRTLSGTSLLWVSDMHFSDHHHAFPVYPAEATPEQTTLAERIKKDVLPQYDEVSGLILSGDFTWKASDEEFVYAKNFIENLQTQIANKSGQLVICPGNHDLKWSEDPSDKKKEVTTADEEARESYEKFYRQLFYQNPNEYMTMGRQFLLDRAYPVEIASLNSSFLQQEKDHFQGHGFTGEGQRHQVAQKMDWTPENKRTRTIRMVVVHHDVLPTTFTARLQKEAPYSLMLDAEGLLQWATKYRVDVILHGHKHQPAYNALQRRHPDGGMHTVHIVAMGSGGVEANHLAEINQNVVGVLTFEGNHLQCDTYRVRPNATTDSKIDQFSYTLPLSPS